MSEENISLDHTLEKLFKDKIISNNEFGHELWSALANIKWHHKSGIEEAHTFRSAGGLISDMIGEGHYMDWYCNSPDGFVSEFISGEMAKEGWHYSNYA